MSGETALAALEVVFRYRSYYLLGDSGGRFLPGVSGSAAGAIEAIGSAAGVTEAIGSEACVIAAADFVSAGYENGF